MTQLKYLQGALAASISPMDYLKEKKEQSQEMTLVDVRNAPPELKKTKIAGAMEIPLSELKQRLSELPKEKMIIVYCWDVWCNMAKYASMILLENGYSVKELYGGIAAWNELKLPIEPV